ncbi:MAG: MucB/RseB C-terminal domain-containing protein [Steroidobacteraceae bacterium]|nr:MucB/RseB C-terminal domain-containing protein [Nevskiaceae bacterium]MCP5339663.1 MucB/RseB C-terminal domain-containing protein [Nevskiaceae bacterium]MCP5360684.1 MucB/RseB C-terminal domain-containing protein [Nevskiaceae bacterium]
MIRPAVRRAQLLLVAVSLAGAALAAASEPREWLLRMNEALTTRNYDGTFFHLRDGRVETLRVIHRVQDGQVMERLQSLDGSGREFIRGGSELTCYLPDQRVVLVERRPQDGPLLGNLPRFDATTAEFYDVRAMERRRLMGRTVRVVSVDPRDQYRYGYRLWIDEKTAMPLKTELCDGEGRVVEQIVFASLSLPERIPDTAFQPQLATQGWHWLRQEPGLAAVSAEPALESPVPIEALRLPPGFRMTVRGQQVLPGADRAAAHFVFSDGVASVSLFVEPRPGGTAAGFIGPAQLGSSSAYSTSVEGHQVTVVGEVPPSTVEFIAAQVQAARGTTVAAGRRTRGPAAPATTVPRFEQRGGEALPAESPARPAFVPSSGVSPAAAPSVPRR